jgi:hypothetical protein
VQRRKKPKAQKKRKMDEDDVSDDDGPDSTKYLVSRAVGAVQFTLHRQCNFAADTGCVFVPDRAFAPAAVGNGDGDGEHGGGGGEEGDEDKTLRVAGLEIGPLYDCDEVDDAECDLCGRPGGIMQFFDVDPARSSLPPPGEEVSEWCCVCVYLYGAPCGLP